jgi:hypothetical protein
MIRKGPMRTLATFVLVPVAIFALAACDDENFFENADVAVGGVGGGTGVTYEAVRLEFENEIGDVIDLVDLGALFLLTLDREETTFASELSYLDIEYETTGTYEVQGDTIFFSDSPFDQDSFDGEVAFEFDDTGDVIFLRDGETAWDVDNDGVAEVASLDVRLDRRDD